MARILLILSLLISGGTCYLGFVTKGKISGLQTDLSGTRENLKSTTASLNETKGKLTQTEEKLTAANATIEEKEKEIAAQKQEKDKLGKELAEANALVKMKTEEMAGVSAKLADLEKKLGSGNPEELAASVEQLKGDLDKVKLELAEVTQVRTTLEQQKKEVEERLAASTKTIEDYKAQFTRPGLTGKVMAYNPGWNFVVLNLGDKHGIRANAQMLVTRGSQTVARLKVTNVEPSTSIADIVPGSESRGLRMQPGDSVIFEGK